MSPLQSAKLWIVSGLGLPKDTLHVYAALALFFGSAVLFRWQLSDRRPWLVVLIAALVGEAWDLCDSIVYDTPVRLGANWHDIWNTLLWPAVIFALAKYTKRLRV